LRSLLGKAPEAKEVGERLGRLVRRMLKGAVVDASPRKVILELHPFAPPVRVVVLDDGDLEVKAGTAVIGPGYHDDVLARLAPVLDELDYVWEGDAGDPRTVLPEWLAAELRAGRTRIGVPSDRSFVIDAAVLTALGPRDAGWRDAVLADPQHGRDVFPWWDTGPGHRELSCALLAMWHEVPWREPLDRDERELMKQVDADLRAARKANRELALPYAEWAELVALLGDDERAATLRAQANGAATIGYRRHDMDVEAVEGWTLRLPGAFVGSWEEANQRYWATDGDRVLELSALETTEHDSAKLIGVAPERHPVIERIADGERQGRAEVYDEDDVHIVHGLVAIAPRVAILTCKGRASDEPWALATWRSLRTT
jgi:hypothetical protein